MLEPAKENDVIRFNPWHEAQERYCKRLWAIQLGITMNLYVHVTEDGKQREIVLAANTLNML